MTNCGTEHAVRDRGARVRWVPSGGTFLPDHGGTYPVQVRKQHGIDCPSGVAGGIGGRGATLRHSRCIEGGRRTGLSGHVQWLPFILEAGEVAIVGPTYGEYALAWRRTNCHPVSMVDSLRFPRQRYVVVCQPNNLTAELIHAVLLSLSEQLQTLQVGISSSMRPCHVDLSPLSSRFGNRGSRCVAFHGQVLRASGYARWFCGH